MGAQLLPSRFPSCHDARCSSADEIDSSLNPPSVSDTLCARAVPPLAFHREQNPSALLRIHRSLSQQLHLLVCLCRIHHSGKNFVPLLGNSNGRLGTLSQCRAFLVSGMSAAVLNAAWHSGMVLKDFADGLVGTIDLDECIERLYRKELLAESVIEAICAKAKELLMKESNVVHIQAPVTVVGDIHGQFFDLLEIFRIGGFCPNTNYLFLG